MAKITKLLILWAAPLFCRASLPKISLKQISTKDRVLVDPSGRQRIFHGVNAVVKGPPWLPSRGSFDAEISLVKEDFEMMRAAGINNLRLGLMWPGAEPKRGMYDDTYYKRALEIIEEAATYGIYTFVDMHQDAYSEYFCGEGLPDWAVNQSGTGFHFPQPLMSPFKPGPDGFPMRQDCNRLDHEIGMGGQGGYLSANLGQATQNLYQNVGGLADAWGLFLARFAGMAKGMGSVLGINLINEPWTGQAWHNPFKMIPQVANRMLQGAYNIVAGHIRNASSDILLFFPAVVWSDMHGLDMNNGFTAPPGGAAYADRSIFSIHYYIPPQTSGSAHRYIQDYALSNARRLQTALFVTETGGMDRPAAPWEEIAPEAEAAGVSWNYWEWKTFCKETPATLNSTSQWAAYGSCKTGYGGQLFNQTGMVLEKHRKLARMYAYAVQGLLTTHTYKPENSSLNFSYQLDPSIDAPTEVYASQKWHGQGSADFDVTVSPAGVTKFEIVATGNEALSIRIHALEGATAGKLTVFIAPSKKGRLSRQELLV